MNKTRALLPVAAAVVMLLGVVVACALVLREVLDVVLWSLDGVAAG